MPIEQPIAEKTPVNMMPIADALRTVQRPKFLGITFDDAMHYFFRGNATISILVLFLIIVFLFKEGGEYFGQNKDNLTIYRQAGLEFVDLVRSRVDDHRSLERFLGDIRIQEFKNQNEDLSKLAAFDASVERFSVAIEGHQAFLSNYSEIAKELKEKFKVGQDLEIAKINYQKEGKFEESAKIVIPVIDFESETKVYRDSIVQFKGLNESFQTEIESILSSFPPMPSLALQPRLEKFCSLVKIHQENVRKLEEEATQWDWQKPVTWGESFTSFIFGRNWLTASFWQDWYGIIPLFVGSLMIAVTAIMIAVPFAIGAAIYVNQVASRHEQNIIKPYIEFVSAVPSVVWGFFGIAVVGQLIRAFSEQGMVAWIPFFPISERLNIATASCLLAIMAIPTIFSLAEDAIQNVPNAYTESSLALGATKFQTIWIIMIPSALSGIVSAIILGLGRVIGETMVVLLCSGGRIKIPDFSTGLGVIFQPVHTMTGIIAQEMGEVVNGSIHYRALFMVGIVLFFISLALNYAAQQVVKRYKISIG